MQSIKADLLKYLDVVFPGSGDGPYWAQSPYRDDLFALCQRAIANERSLHEDSLRHFLGEWKQGRPPLRTDAVRDLERMADAWGEWIYAHRNLVK